MKKLLFSLLTFSASPAILAQYPTEKDPFLTQPLSGKTFQHVKSETSGGNISVTGVASSEARIEVFVWPGNRKNGEKFSKEEIQKRLQEDYDLKISVEGNKLTAIAKSKTKIRDWKNALSISFRIFGPRDVSTDLATSGGNIQLNNLSGTQEFATSGGNLQIDNVSGKLNGRTSGGNINVTNAKQEVKLTTSGGNITASQCSGNIRLTTSGGSVKLKDLNGNIEASTSGGNVTGDAIRGELDAHTSGGNVNLHDLSCSLETSTSGGNIDVEMKELGKYVKIEGSGGNIHLQLPGQKGYDLNLKADKINTKSLNNFSGTIDDDRIDGKLNGGGIPVTVRGGSSLSLTLK